MGTDISGVRNAPGFDQTSYDELMEQARSTKVDAALVDRILLESMAAGYDFRAAADHVSMVAIPSLSKPTAELAELLKEWPSLPSPGVCVMAVVVRAGITNRTLNRQAIWQKTESIVQSLRDQAKAMEKAADEQFNFSIGAGCMQIAGGLLQMGGGVMGLRAIGKGGDAAGGAAQSWGSLGQGAGGVTQGVSTMLNAAGQKIAAEAQAHCKELEADQEKERAARASTEKLTDTLGDIIKDAVREANDFSSSTNQTRQKLTA